MTTYIHRAIIVVTTAVAAAANAKAQETTGFAADLKAWTVPLSSTGQLPATHYGCNWAFTQAWWDKLSNLFAALPPNVKDKIRVFKLDDPDPALGRPTPEEVLAQLGLRRIEAEIS